MGEENEQLPSQPTAASPPEAQPTNNNNLEDTPKEETGGTRVMIDNNTDPNNITYGTITTSEKKSSERKEYLESLVTSGLQQHQHQQQDYDNIEDGKNKNEHTTTNIIEAFYNIAWPILESEGGWTMVRCLFFINFSFFHVVPGGGLGKLVCSLVCIPDKEGEGTWKKVG
jgi:ribosomal protein L17